MLELTPVNWCLKDICIVTSKPLVHLSPRWPGGQIQVIYKEKSYLSKLLYAVAQSVNFTHLIPLQIKLYCHLLHFMLHKPLLQSTLLCPVKILLSSPCLKFAVLLFSPPPCQQLGWPQMEHIWQLKWPRCWIWSHLPSCSSWAHIRLLSCWLSSCPWAVPSVHPKALTKGGGNALNLWGLLAERIIKTKGFKSRQWSKPNTLPSFLFYPSFFPQSPFHNF